MNRILLSFIVGSIIFLSGCQHKLAGNNQQVPPVSDPVLTVSCDDQTNEDPRITSMSSYSGSLGSKLEISGCHFAGFEGDINVWIENSQGIKGLVHGEGGSTDQLIKVTLQSPLCQIDTSYSGLECGAWLTLDPGIYTIFTAPWGIESNKVSFTVIE